MPGRRVATEWHLQQSPAMRDSLLTLPLLASLRDPTITPHQALRPPISFTHTHTSTHIACWAIAHGVYVLPPWAKWSDRSKHCWYKLAWIRVTCKGHRWENVKWTVTICPDLTKDILLVLTSLIFTCPPRAHILSKIRFICILYYIQNFCSCQGGKSFRNTIKNQN